MSDKVSPYKGKSQVPTFFGRWLTLMEEAWDGLSEPEFVKLEDAILKEIRVSRRARPQAKEKT